MSYRAVTVTLENMGAIAVQRDRSGATTAFNVTIAGKRHYAVQMRGEPRLESGMVVTAVLRDTENWQTLAGWLDHATGKVEGIGSPAISFWSFVTVCAISALFAMTWVNESINGQVSAGKIVFLILVTFLANAWSLTSWRKSKAIYRLLNR